MSGFKVFSSGQDLDELFQPRTGTDPSAQLVPFVTRAGQNLSERYYPYTSGTKAIMTGFKFFDTSGNIQDLNDYYRKGPSWSGVGSGTSSAVTAISVLDASNVYVGGLFTTVLDVSGVSVTGTSRIAKWNANTSTWSALIEGANNTVRTIYALDLSNVYVGGEFSKTDASYNRFAIWNANTSTWRTLGTGVSTTGISVVYAVYAVNTSNVYVGGIFANASGIPGTTNIAKWNGTTWTRMGSGSMSNTVSYAVTSIYAVNTSNVYVGGNFNNVLDVSGNAVAKTAYIAKWNGSTWSALGSGMNSTVNAIYALNASNVYVGGAFTNALDAGGNPVAKTAYIAKWNGSTWSALGSGTTSTVNAIYALDESNVYVGGVYANALDVSGNPVSGTFGISKWNGNNWSALVSGLSDNAAVSIGALNTFNVYIGGSFTKTDASYNYIAKWG